MKLGFGLSILGLLLAVAAFITYNGGLGIRLGDTEPGLLQGVMVIGSGIFILGLVRIFSKSMERNKG